MSYQLVFDVGMEGYRGWTLLWLFVLFSVVGAGWILLRRRYPTSRRSRLARIGPYLFTSVTVPAMLVGNITTYLEYRELISRLRTGEFKIVEGRVEQFDPMPWEGHKNESFVVDGHRYSYSDYDGGVGFNRTSSHGGPIRQGLNVRIADINGVIARLEIAQ
jgi:hypothetical protein